MRQKVSNFQAQNVVYIQMFLLTILQRETTLAQDFFYFKINFQILFQESYQVCV